MLGVPSDLPLACLIGHSLEQIALGRFQIWFHFSGPVGTPDSTIGVEGNWELHDTAGALIDSAQEFAEREFYRVHLLLGSTVADFRIAAPRSFTLIFDSGFRLTVYDDSPHYEAFSVCIAETPEIHV